MKEIIEKLQAQIDDVAKGNSLSIHISIPDAMSILAALRQTEVENDLIKKIDLLKDWVSGGRVKATRLLPDDDLLTLINQIKILAMQRVARTEWEAVEKEKPKSTCNHKDNSITPHGWVCEKCGELVG